MAKSPVLTDERKAKILAYNKQGKRPKDYIDELNTLDGRPMTVQNVYVFLYNRSVGGHDTRKERETAGGKLIRSGEELRHAILDEHGKGGGKHIPPVKEREKVTFEHPFSFGGEIMASPHEVAAWCKANYIFGWNGKDMGRINYFRSTMGEIPLKLCWEDVT